MILQPENPSALLISFIVYCGVVLQAPLDLVLALRAESN